MSQGIAKIRYFRKFQEQKIYFNPIISIGVDLGSEHMKTKLQIPGMCGIKVFKVNLAF